MVRALVVYSHPRDDSFAAAARSEAVAGLRESGAEVRTIDLYAEQFDPRLSAEEHALHRSDPSTRPQIAAHADLLRWCDTIVLVYPTWYGTFPAMLKGWFERVWVNGVASEVRTDGRPPTPLLPHIRHVVAITSHGSSKWVNALQGEAGKRMLKRALRISIGARSRVHWVAIYGMDRNTEPERQAFLDRVRRRCARMR